MSSLARARREHRLAPGARERWERAAQEVLAFLFPRFAPASAGAPRCEDAAVRDELAALRGVLREALLGLPAESVAARAGGSAEDAERIVGDRLACLPRLYEALMLDARALLDGDPAARSLEEVLLADPAFAPSRMTGWRTSWTARASRWRRASSPGWRTTRPESPFTRAQQIVAETPGAWMPQQFENPANVEIYRGTTAREILRDFPEGIDYLITGVGTGGHITAVSEVLKQTIPGLRTFAVEPAKSPVLSGGSPSPHKVQGIGAGFVPAVLDRSVLDGVIQVSEEDGFAMAVRCAKEEGIFVGPSSGAALAAVAQKLPDIADGSRVLTFCYDTGERYLSVSGLFELPADAPTSAAPATAGV